MSKNTITKREARKNRIRAKISGTAECPRLAVFKSNKFIYVQLIDDIKGHTIAATDSKSIKSDSQIEKAKKVGENIAKLGKDKGVTKVVFDRGGFRYAGAIKELADSARSAGLTF
jgi:large subunit ribosomal protein L18